MNRSSWYKNTAVLISSLLIATCSTSQILSPAPEFDWLDRNENDTQSVMQTLAISISRMENAMARERATDERLREINTQLQIIEELGELLAADSGDALTGPNSTRNHLVVYENIDNFLLRVRRAREALVEHPPNYLLVEQVNGYCRVCHQLRDSGIR